MNYMPYPEKTYLEIYDVLFGADAVYSQERE